jgi:hypothetical protein
LAEAQLGQGLPVQLDGTITYCDETRRLMVFQDQSGGIPVDEERAGVTRTPSTQLD